MSYNGNYRQYLAIQKTGENRIKKIAPDMKNESGIYVWYRPIYKFYAGQSVKLLNRSVQHLTQHDHLGLSIMKHGLYDKEKNPSGWRVKYWYCPESELNQQERETIEKWNNGENIAYNITSGGQDNGKFDINQRQAPKGYRDGITQGKKMALREIREFFAKYLDVAIKDKPNKIKERKLKEFKELLCE